MQLASHGARGIPRNVSSAIPGGPARHLHVPSYARVQQPRSVAKRLVSQTRTLLSRFVGHLTTPGLNAPAHSSFTQAIRGSAPGRMSSIHERLSFSARNALARPVQPHFFPRGPSFTASRSVAQIGLGTARNFSSGRSVFQNLVENVPITGRALFEVDWDIHMESEREALKKQRKTSADKKAGRKELLKARNTFTTLSVPESQTSSEMDQYFAAPVTPSVTTNLLIPLAPTPTSRVPLPPDVSDHPSLLPLPALASIHNSHEMHSLRVSALFSRLDAANVWEKGVLCSAYASRADAEGVCTILKVEFTGWTMAEVRSVIGESGTGWCALEEIQMQPDLARDDDAFSDASSILSDISGEAMESMGSTFGVEPSQSLVLPTLDFSSSFAAPTPSIPPSPSSHNIFSDFESDPWVDSSSDDSWVDYHHLGFSSDFARRLQTQEQW